MLYTVNKGRLPRGVAADDLDYRRWKDSYCETYLQAIAAGSRPGRATAEASIERAFEKIDAWPVVERAGKKPFLLHTPSANTVRRWCKDVERVVHRQSKRHRAAWRRLAAADASPEKGGQRHGR